MQSAHQEEHSYQSEMVQGDSLEKVRQPIKREFSPDMATRPMRQVRPGAGGPPRQMRAPRIMAPRPTALRPTTQSNVV